MKDHEPAGTLFHKDAGPEITAASRVAVLCAPFRLLDAVDPSNSAMNFNVRLSHRNGQFIQGTPKSCVVFLNGFPADMYDGPDRRSDVDVMLATRLYLLHRGQVAR